MAVRVHFSAPASAGLSWIEARTALYSWLLARHEGGALVLSIADTVGGEVTSAPFALHVQAPCDDMRWLGLDWDEGPSLRSARLDAYHQRARQIARSGAVAEADLLATDGMPRHVLAAVVDDHELGITHVVHEPGQRPAIPAYRRLAEALGWTPPTFVYLPSFSFDGASARPASLQACRAQGYLGLAVANDLARMGWTPRGKRQLLALADLAARFDLSRLARGPVVPPPGQLDWFNHRCLNGLDLTERTRLMAGWWERAYGRVDRAQGTDLAPAEWQRVLADVVSSEVHALAEVPSKVRFAFVDPVDLDEQAAALLSRPYALQVLSAFAERISCLDPFTYEAIDAAISALRWEFKAALGIRSRDALHVIRAALAGRVDAPCVVAVCQLLGKERCVQRAQQGQQRAHQGLERAQQGQQRAQRVQQVQEQAQQAEERAQRTQEQARQAQEQAQQARARAQQAQQQAQEARDQAPPDVAPMGEGEREWPVS
jgi:glutamyl/glutaminyl-tRNA synthetase